MMLYLDTNVWIARWKTDDPHHAACRRIVEGVSQGRLAAATSVLTVVEGASAFARYHGELDEATREAFPLDRYVGEQTRRLLGLPLRWIHVPGDLELRVGETAVRLPALLREGLALATRTPRRTLDLLHLAAARYGREVLHLPLEAFVTGDRDLLASGPALRRLLGVPLEGPTAFAEAAEL
ncbi:MAG: PIN domain-containing protein [Euryarchaeota archaeon]|nr:PIN domain-containing protein [Euryarchaeota archaeon]